MPIPERITITEEVMEFDYEKELDPKRKEALLPFKVNTWYVVLFLLITVPIIGYVI